jgi:hypothetical protein
MTDYPAHIELGAEVLCRYDLRMISFEPDHEALAEARLLAIEQGITLKEIAVEAFSSFMAAVKAARLGDIGEF